MAEGVGFEPTVRVFGQQFSRLPRSTALPSLHEELFFIIILAVEQIHGRNSMFFVLIFKG